MELSPKQQAVEQIKNANRILIMGHKNTEGDLLGSALALSESLKELGKTVDVVVSDPIPEIFKFLPFTKTIKQNYQHTPGKVIKIDMRKFPAKGMKWQREGDFLNIFLESDKNLKFEHIEIVNGMPKPDLIIVLDTADVERIDTAYDSNTELFFEVPVINIDHHAGNEYFGAVNLIDLTATSTAEILVSLFEALGIKITNPDIATCLLTGIVSDTQSFRSSNTTPKSLTVAAQLLAAGGRQQEIISNLYKKRPMALLKLWGQMLSGIKEDKKHRLAWTKVKLSDINGEGITKEDVLDAADELLTSTPDADIILILTQEKDGEVYGKLKGAKGVDILSLAKLFNGSGTGTEATFRVKGQSLENAEMNVLQKIHGQISGGTEDVWNAIAGGEKEKADPEQTKETAATEPAPEIKPESRQELAPETDVPAADPIDNALKSLSEEKTAAGFTSLKEVIERKKKDLKIESDENIDVFDEED